MNKKPRIAIVPGSFDPITYGHIDLVIRAAKDYDKVYLAVMINPDKNYMFSVEERTNIASAALKNIKNVEVIHYEGMLWELARDLDAIAIVKGYRNEDDLKYEKAMEKYNFEKFPQAKTILLKSNDKLLNISSTIVRKKIQGNEDISPFLPISAINEIQKIIEK